MSMHVLKMVDMDLTGKRVLIRQDLNVPIKDGVVTSDKRIVASIPTLQKALNAGASVAVMSHLGRPAEGEYDEQYSLKPVADYLRERLGCNVNFVKDWLDGFEWAEGELTLVENVRFNSGEKKNAEALSRKMAALCDVFVMDAFGTAHRAEASTSGIAQYAPEACAGPLLVSELEALEKALQNPLRPMIAIVGGSKVSTKLTVLENLTKKVDRMIVGGGILNTFIAAAGYVVGKSLYEPDLVETAKLLYENAKKNGSEIPLPEDVVCAKVFAEHAQATVKHIEEVGADDMILDIGPKTAATFAALLKDAGTIVWNGPVGVFEFEAFSGGTRALAAAIGESTAFSLAGGGDTLAAIDKYGIEEKLSYISTGGGAFLEYLEGKPLPAVTVLEGRKRSGV